MAFIKVYSMRIWNINTQPTPIRNTTVGAPSKAVENRHLDKLEGALGTQPTFLHSIFVSFMRCSCAFPFAPPPNKWANRSTSFDMNVCLFRKPTPHIFLLRTVHWNFSYIEKCNIYYFLFLGTSLEVQSKKSFRSEVK